MASRLSTTPLTTIYTPAGTCTLPLIAATSSADYHVWGTTSGTTTIQKVEPFCFPPGFRLEEDVAYSPGVCPSGQTMAQVTVDSGSGVTQAHCCPSNAPFVTTGSYAHCQSPAATPGTLIIAGLATTGGIWQIVQKALIVEWRSQDLPLFTPASAPLPQLNRASQSVISITAALSEPTHPAVGAPSGSVPATATSATPATRNTTTGPSKTSTTHDSPQNTSTIELPSPSATTSQPSLSTAAKAGIGVGAAVGGLILLLLIALILTLRKKQVNETTRRRSLAKDPHEDHLSGKSYVFNGWGTSRQMNELDDQRMLVELSSERKRAELVSVERPRVELEGSYGPGYR